MVIILVVGSQTGIGCKSVLICCGGNLVIAMSGGLMGGRVYTILTNKTIDCCC